MPGFNPYMAGAGALMGIGAGIGSWIGANNLKKQLTDLSSQDPTYQVSPYAAQRLGLAQTLFNGRMPGATQQEQNIYGTQGNTMANIQRNAGDSSQALALGGATQGRTNAAFGDLNQQELQDYQRRYGNLSGAQEGMTAEHTKQYEDSVRQWQDKINIAMAKHAVGQQTAQTFANMGGAMMSPMGGGFDYTKLFNNGGGGGMTVGGGGGGVSPYGPGGGLT
jgi:hypothetical protein